MLNPYQTLEAVVLSTRQETPAIKSFVFKLSNNKSLEYNPGQFFVFSLPGFGESVFVPAEHSLDDNTYDIAVAKVGTVTTRFHTLEKGDTFGLRGPYGNGFDLRKVMGKPILFIAGGLGIVPIRSLFSHLTKRYCNRYGAPIQLFYGAKSYEDLAFREEFKKWQKCLDLEVSLSKPQPDTVKGWKAHLGFVTALFHEVKVVKGGVAILCGPSVMFNAVIPELLKAGYKPEDIYLSLERRMECAGLGTCQHCCIGPYYVCKDGPVFTYAQLKDTVQYE